MRSNQVGVIFKTLTTCRQQLNCDRVNRKGGYFAASKVWPSGVLLFTAMKPMLLAAPDETRRPRAISNARPSSRQESEQTHQRPRPQGPERRSERAWWEGRVVRSAGLPAAGRTHQHQD